MHLSNFVWILHQTPGQVDLKCLQKPAFLLEDEYSGENIESKLKRIREKMKENGCNAHILSSLDDIAWLFNIRGNDIAYCPLVLSYAIVYNNSVELFAEQARNFLKK